MGYKSERCCNDGCKCGRCERENDCCEQDLFIDVVVVPLGVLNPGFTVATGNGVQVGFVPNRGSGSDFNATYTVETYFSPGVQNVAPVASAPVPVLVQNALVNFTNSNPNGLVSSFLVRIRATHRRERRTVDAYKWIQLAPQLLV